MSKASLERIVEVSVQAFCRGKSRTHPYLATWHDDLWVLQDGPGKKRDPRKIEVFTCGLSPRETVERIKSLGLGWHFICAAHPDESDFKEVRQAYKELGYRALATEWFFVHDLKNIPHFDSEPPVRIVESPEELATIRQRAPQPRRFRTDGTRHYCVWDEDFDFGWVHSVPYGEDNWVSDLFVYREFRNRGYGKALMSRLLADDQALGVNSSVLIASTAGARIYPSLGYEQVGVLHVLCPVNRDS